MSDTEYRQSKTAWVLFLLALGATAVVAQQWGKTVTRAREAEQRAEVAAARADSVAQAKEQERELLTAQRDSAIMYWARVVDSLTVLPPPTPALSPEMTALLDTAAMTRQVREAVDSLRAKNAALVVENTELRERIVELQDVHARVVADLRTSYENEIRTYIEENGTLRLALEASQEEAARWKDASGMGFFEKAKWMVIGAGVGLGVDYLLDQRKDNGSVVVVQDTPCHDY